MLINDEFVSNESQIASGLNEYFSTIGKELDQKLHVEINPIPIVNRFVQCHNFLFAQLAMKKCLKIMEKYQKLSMRYALYSC